MGQKAFELNAQERQELEELKNYPHFYRELFARIFLYWRGPEKWVAWGLFCGAIFFTVAVVGAHAAINFWYKEFYDALQNYNAGRFWILIFWFACIASVYIGCTVAKKYLIQLLALRWRRFMTEHYVNFWLSERLYYFLQLFSHKTDNPDQRLADDFRKFTSETLALFFLFFEAGLLLLTFVGILWQLSGTLVLPLGGIVITIPGYLAFAALLYAALGTWVTKKTVSSLLPLDFQNEKREGNFRYGLVRVREHGESIAFYRGEKREQGCFRSLFQDIYVNGYQIISKMLGVNMWIAFYGQILMIVPYLLMAPRFFAERLAIGILAQVGEAFKQVADAFSVIITNYTTIISWKASTLRILTFEAHLKELAHQMKDSAIHRNFGETDDILVRGLTLRTPTGEEICTVPERRFLKGHSVLIQGDSGIGKSSFLRGLGGLWPFGEGEITEPASASFFFLPQKPYIPLGSLAEALVYPQKSDLYTSQVLQELLIQVGLEKFVDALDQVDYWPGLLSGGEQQRLAFARLLLQKPDWAFLDEATSALDEESEKKLYELVRQSCPLTTLISVGHRPSLKVFHAETWNFPARQEVAA